MKNPQINKELLDSLIRDSGVPFKENSISFIFDCPRCGKSKKLYIRKKDGKFICFRCADEGFRGGCEYALVELLSISLEEAKQSLYGELKVDYTGKKLFLDLTLPDDDFGQPEEELQTVSYPPQFIGFEHKELTKNAVKYLCEKRGLKPERLIEYKLKFNPNWNTVVFPVEYQGLLYGWQERSIFNDFRYTLKGLKKENVLMFQDRLDSSEHAILTEGPMDALKAHLCGR